MNDLSLHSNTEYFVQKLLSQKAITDLLHIRRMAKEYLDKNKPMHELISKYRQFVWFRRIMFMTEEQITEKYFYLAKWITYHETQIADIDDQLRGHGMAKEELHKSMKPFDGINLSEHTLQQQTLF